MKRVAIYIRACRGDHFKACLKRAWREAAVQGARVVTVLAGPPFDAELQAELSFALAARQASGEFDTVIVEGFASNDGSEPVAQDGSRQACGCSARQVAEPVQ